MKKELEILNDKLLGEFISRVSIGDTWELFIGDYILSTHSIEFKEENQITEFLKKNYDKFNFTIDKEDISKSTLLTANIRKVINKVSIDKLKNLIIDFENGSTLKILTNTDIVDWQWCINKSGNDPYIDFEIACFFEGEVEIS